MKWRQRFLFFLIRIKLSLQSLFSLRQAAAAAFRLFCTVPSKQARRPIHDLEEAEWLSHSFHGMSLQVYRLSRQGAPKLLLIHGFASQSLNFTEYIRALHKKGYEVLAFDAPGHGRSQGRQLQIPLYVEAIDSISKAFGPFHNYVAHSFGGLALAHYLEKQGDNEDYRVAFIAPATETVTAIDQFFAQLQLSNRLRKEFDQHILRISGQPASYYSIRRAMHHIKSTIFWIHDESDTITPIADALKVKEDGHLQIQWHITKGLGHRRIYREPSTLQGVIDFF
jgi:pimeloyl-ACP methyl ester carboxylesterase